MQEPYRKGSSESILTTSLAGDIVRCFLKRRSEASVGRAIELRKARRSGCRLHSDQTSGPDSAFRKVAQSGSTGFGVAKFAFVEFPFALQSSKQAQEFWMVT